MSLESKIETLTAAVNRLADTMSKQNTGGPAAPAPAAPAPAAPAPAAPAPAAPAPAAPAPAAPAPAAPSNVSCSVECDADAGAPDLRSAGSRGSAG